MIHNQLKIFFLRNQHSRVVLSKQEIKNDDNKIFDELSRLFYCKEFLTPNQGMR